MAFVKLHQNLQAKEASSDLLWDDKSPGTRDEVLFNRSLLFKHIDLKQKLNSTFKKFDRNRYIICKIRGGDAIVNCARCIPLSFFYPDRWCFWDFGRKSTRKSVICIRLVACS